MRGVSLSRISGYDYFLLNPRKCIKAASVREKKGYPVRLMMAQKHVDTSPPNSLKSGLLKRGDGIL
jgi:hypothetical protein